MAFEATDEAVGFDEEPFFSDGPFPMAFNVKADDLRQRIMIKMAATVRTTPPITADKIVIKDRLSENGNEVEEKVAVPTVNFVI